MADCIPSGSFPAFKPLPTETYGERLSGEYRRHAQAFTCYSNRLWPIVELRHFRLKPDPLKIRETAQ